MNSSSARARSAGASWRSCRAAGQPPTRPFPGSLAAPDRGGPAPRVRTRAAVPGREDVGCEARVREVGTWRAVAADQRVPGGRPGSAAEVVAEVVADRPGAGPVADLLAIPAPRPPSRPLRQPGRGCPRPRRAVTGTRKRPAAVTTAPAPPAPPGPGAAGLGRPDPAQRYGRTGCGSCRSPGRSGKPPRWPAADSWPPRSGRRT